MTKLELHQLRWIKKSIEVLEDRLCILEAESTKVTSSAFNQSGKSKQHQDKMAEIISKIVETQEEINHELSVLYAREKDVLRTIAALPEKEQCLMILRYVQCMEWKDICEKMNYSWRQVHYIHASALKMMCG